MEALGGLAEALTGNVRVSRQGPSACNPATYGTEPDDRDGINDFTVMAISGHRSVRMLERYTHPTSARKIDALESFNDSMGRIGAETTNAADGEPSTARNSLEKFGGRQGDRTPDLCIANGRGRCE
jgi:hypothetical protein